jgi:hypothetical protein
VAPVSPGTGLIAVLLLNPNSLEPLLLVTLWFRVWPCALRVEGSRRFCAPHDGQLVTVGWSMAPLLNISEQLKQK